MHKDSITTCKIINQTQQSKKIYKPPKIIQFCTQSLIMTKDYVLSTKYWGGEITQTIPCCEVMTDVGCTQLSKHEC